MTHAEMVEKIARELAAYHECFEEDVWTAFVDQLDGFFLSAARAGFALVPLEATEEMINRGVAQLMHFSEDHESPSDGALLIYEAFVAARPGQEKEDV